MWGGVGKLQISFFAYLSFKMCTFVGFVLLRSWKSTQDRQKSTLFFKKVRYKFLGLQKIIELSLIKIKPSKELYLM